jgi:hypothetical protein
VTYTLQASGAWVHVTGCRSAVRHLSEYWKYRPQEPGCTSLGAGQQYGTCPSIGSTGLRSLGARHESCRVHVTARVHITAT